MKSQYLTKLKLPDKSGIYIFRDSKKRPLYIGRATSLKNRVKSYFSKDLIETRGPRLVDMVTKASSLTHEVTDTLLEAIFLESSLIKKYQPYYNVAERDDKSAQYIVITEEEWPRVFLVRARDFEKDRTEGKLDYKVKKYFGPYTHSLTIRQALKILRRMFPFRDHKAHDPRHEQFYRSIGRSPDTNGTSSRETYQETIDHLIMFFEGKKRQLRSKLKKEMIACAKVMRFEDANSAKRLLYALDHIDDVALIRQDRGGMYVTGQNYRIEAYDVAHMNGKNVVGVMVAMVNGQNASSEYRKFKIKYDANNDLAGLREILFRRFNHPEWAFPDLIVVDGGKTHVEHAEAALRARRIAIPIVAVTKDEKHKAATLIGNPELTKKYKKEIIAINAEAHRFAIKYHRNRRTKGLVL